MSRVDLVYVTLYYILTRNDCIDIGVERVDYISREVWSSSQLLHNHKRLLVLKRILEREKGTSFRDRSSVVGDCENS